MSDFWKFEACSKIDILKEKRHVHLINAALQDENTNIGLGEGNSFILYNGELALLVQCTSPSLYSALYVFYMFNKLREPAL